MVALKFLIQIILNNSRYSKLKKQSPNLFTNPLIKWDELKITDCHNPKEGRQFFHGFLITYRPKPSIEQSKKEIKKIKEFIAKTSLVNYKICRIYSFISERKFIDP